MYGYPLLAWQRHASQLLIKTKGSTFYHAQELATDNDTSVARPNADTLYSTLIYDLSQADLVLNVPDVPEDTFKLFICYGTWEAQDPGGGLDLGWRLWTT